MDEIRKIKAIKAVTNTEFLPTVDIEAETAGYSKYFLSDIAALGTGWAAFASEFEKAVSAGKGMSGLYRVEVPGSGQLFQRKNGKGYIGSVQTEAGTVGGGQATLTPIGVDPITIAVAVALMNVEKKLGDIQEIQEEMKDFLEKREKSKQKGDLLFMSDILNQYKYNWDNEQFKQSRHVKVLDIRQSAEQNIVFYRSLIEKHLGKSGIIQLGPDVKRRIEKQVDLLNDYQLAIYLYAMSAFLDVILVDNYNEEYLNSVIGKIDDYSFDYRMLYTKVYERLDTEYKKSLSALALKGVELSSKGAGSLAEKIPVAKKASVDEKLQLVGERIEDAEKQKNSSAMEDLIEKQSGNVKPFVDNLMSLNSLYNEPVNVLVDGKTLYIGA